MKRIPWITAALLASALWCAAQTAPAPGVPVPSSRSAFGRECGITDFSPQSAIGFSRSADGEWRRLSREMRAGVQDSALARIWHEKHWMVDLHDSPGGGMHTGQMCFDEGGQLTRLIDRYVEMQGCGCLRFTSLRLDGSGKVVAEEQTFVNANTGQPMAAPEAAKGFPAVFGYRRLEQLPFYSLVKQ